MGTDAPVEASIQEIGDKIDRGTCILFLGAGVHHQPPERSPFTYTEEERPRRAEMSWRIALPNVQGSPRGSPTKGSTRVGGSW